MSCSPECPRPRWFPSRWLARPYSCNECGVEWYTRRAWSGGWHGSIYVWRRTPQSPFSP